MNFHQAMHRTGIILVHIFFLVSGKHIEKCLLLKETLFV